MTLRHQSKVIGPNIQIIAQNLHILDNSYIDSSSQGPASGGTGAGKVSGSNLGGGGHGGSGIVSNCLSGASCIYLISFRWVPCYCFCGIGL